MGGRRGKGGGGGAGLAGVARGWWWNNKSDIKLTPSPGKSCAGRRRVRPGQLGAGGQNECLSLIIIAVVSQ